MADASKQSMESMGNKMAGGLATAGVFNAVFGRNKQDGWKALFLVALLLGAFHSMAAYWQAWKKSSTYSTAEKWKVRLLPVGLFMVVYFSVPTLYSFVSMASKAGSPWWNLFMGLLPIAAFVLLGKWVHSILKNIHNKNGNETLSFGRHLVCSVSIVMFTTMYIQYKVTMDPHNSVYATVADKAQYDKTKAYLEQKAIEKSEAPARAEKARQMVMEQQQRRIAAIKAEEEALKAQRDERRAADVAEHRYQMQRQQDRGFTN